MPLLDANRPTEPIAELSRSKAAKPVADDHARDHDE